MRGSPPEPRRKVPFTKPHKHDWKFAKLEEVNKYRFGMVFPQNMFAIWVCECGAIKQVQARQLTKLEKRGAEK